jgi:hypothetical protein
LVYNGTNGARSQPRPEAPGGLSDHGCFFGRDEIFQPGRRFSGGAPTPATPPPAAVFPGLPKFPLLALVFHSFLLSAVFSFLSFCSSLLARD